MKLLLCTKCIHVFSLTRESKEIRECSCGKTKGAYLEDGVNAWYSGEHAMPLGFTNFSLSVALRDQPESGWGKNFEAFVIPKECPTFEKRIEDESKGGKGNIKNGGVSKASRPAKRKKVTKLQKNSKTKVVKSAVAKKRQEPRTT